MKKFTSNFLFLLLSSSLTVLINALAASSSTLEFSRLITTSNDAWLTISSRLKIDTKGDIYAIDGINNNLQIDEVTTNNNLQEVYIVDGFNNTLQKRDCFALDCYLLKIENISLPKETVKYKSLP
jgi:hypothetical protein